MDKFIIKSKGEPFYGTDIKLLCENKVNIVQYNQLYNLDSIDEIFKPYNAAIILYTFKKDVGHWCALINYPKERKIEFFDPYGMKPDEELNFISDKFRRQDHEDKPYLSNLLKRSGRKIIWNAERLQKFKEDTSTCGRWCGLRVVFKNLELKKFIRMFVNQKFDPDWYVTALTLFVRE